MTQAARQQTAPGDFPAQSRLIDLVFPGDTNHHGTLFGGAGFALMDRIAFIAATRHGRVPFVTASCDRIDFRAPARIGQLVELVARPVRAGRRSLAVDVEMIAEDLIGGERHLCTRGSFAMVAMPEGGDADWRLPAISADMPEPAGDRLRMTDIVFADQVNSFGKMFGGDALAAMTKAAFVVASRHSRMVTVLASSRRIDFRHPIPVGSIIDVVAGIVRTGRSSVTVAVELWSETLLDGRRQLTARGEFVMVSVGPDGRPVREARGS
ncbi:acyl-CoA thioesterase [Rhizobium sp. Root483D2]|uniref:acyl-CoA thioesterase n=1 Tax=Rhizobium sp. Root483D2 TaxID=1736545 RepID=UPI0007137BC5|nr:acyl-CoA thioesterase [Rhizobium sp. Root483D2]KQY45739.1 acyl-CoA thioesterase [Rhizobium sp. Root483D2]